MPDRGFTLHFHIWFDQVADETVQCLGALGLIHLNLGKGLDGPLERLFFDLSLLNSVDRDEIQIPHLIRVSTVNLSTYGFLVHKKIIEPIGT